MGAELPLKRSFGPFPKLRIYTGDIEGVRASDNPWERFRYLANLKPRPSRFRVGDFVLVITSGHEYEGQQVRVTYANGDQLEVIKGAKTFHLTSKDVKWIRYCRS